MTPSEMATWLARETDLIARDEGNSGRQSREAIFDAIVDWMRQQPTDAQKIEALKAAAGAGFWGNASAERIEIGDDIAVAEAYSASKLAARNARKSLRLLGIEDEA